MQNHAASASQSLDHLYYHFAVIFSDIVNYIWEGKRISVEGVPVKKFDSKLFLKR